MSTRMEKASHMHNDGDDMVEPHRHEPCDPERGHALMRGKDSGNHGSSIAFGHKVKERRILLVAMTVTGITMVVEFMSGIWTNSLALMSDAGHMLTHFLALTLSYAAIWISSRESSPDYSFGFYRSETLSALFNSFFLLVVSGFILREAYLKFMDPGPILVFEMFVIALLGLVVNIGTAWLLHKANPGSDLNIQGAFVHMLGDTFSSVGVVVGAIIIHYTGYVMVDPILSVLITVLILIWVYKLIKSAIKVLLERSPENVDRRELIETVKRKIPEVREIHDVHIWEITTNMYNMTAHITLDDLRLHDAMPVIAKVKRLVRKEFNIGHAIIQLECDCCNSTQ